MAASLPHLTPLFSRMRSSYDYDKYFVDGTKVEANVDRYSYVWGKARGGIQRNCKRKCEHCWTKLIRSKPPRKAGGDKDLKEIGEGKEIDSEN